MADFGTFIFSVIDHWIGLLSGCVLMVLVALFEKYILKREVSIRIYTIILAGLVFWACFQAWKEQYEVNKVAPVSQRSLDDLKIEASRKETEIRDLKDFKTTATAELTILRHEKDGLQRELNGKLTEIKSLHDDIMLARASSIKAVIKSIDPYFKEEPNETRLVIPITNSGQTDTTIVSSEMLVFIGGKQYSRHQETISFILRPKAIFNFNKLLPKIIYRDLKEGTTTLRAIVEFTAKDILGHEDVGCLVYEYTKEGDTFDQPTSAPKECKKSVQAKRREHTS